MLNKEFEIANGEQIELKTNADLMEKRLDAASRLIAGLGSEHSRWSQELEDLAVARVKLLGDCLVASSFLRYIDLLYALAHKLKLKSKNFISIYFNLLFNGSIIINTTFQ